MVTEAMNVAFSHIRHIRIGFETYVELTAWTRTRLISIVPSIWCVSL